jgi:hypothetical protein
MSSLNIGVKKYQTSDPHFVKTIMPSPMTIKTELDMKRVIKKMKLGDRKIRKVCHRLFEV